MKYSVVIPSKNAKNLQACTEAVRRNEPDAPIVVVDDGLMNVVVPMLVKFKPGVSPFVYARNINIGIRAAIEDEPDVDGVVLLNDDALLETPRGFAIMAEATVWHPDYGIIGATTKVTGNRNQFPKGIGLRDEPRMVTFICVYIPRSTIERVGLLDEEFIHYGYEDDSYCLRVRRAGLKIGIHDGCYVDHGSLTSTFRGDPHTAADLRRNREIFIRKWGTYPA